MEIVETSEKDIPLKYHQKVNQGTFYYRKFFKVNAIITNLPIFIDPQKPQTRSTQRHFSVSPCYYVLNTLPTNGKHELFYIFHLFFLFQNCNTCSYIFSLFL